MKEKKYSSKGRIIRKIERVRKMHLYLAVFVFCFTNSTCRKVTVNHKEYIGNWRTEYYDCQHYVIIEENNKGLYGASGSIKGCITHVGGETRVNKEHLYIGYVEFNILHEPELMEDSIKLNPTREEYTKVLAKMTLKGSIYRNYETYTYYKIK